MANVTIPSTGVREPSERALAHERIAREKREEAARQRASTIDAPWHNDTIDPNNFGRDDLDPQHVAMFNGATGGRREDSFPQRTLDSGLSFHPTPPGFPEHNSSRDTASPHHPEVLTTIIQELWTPSTSHGALGQALAVATDAPPSIAAPSDPAITVSPPIDLDNIPEPPDPPEDSSLAARMAAREEAAAAKPAAKPAAKNKEEPARQSQSKS